MTPGPTNYYKCPNCDNIISRRSINSGNTMASKLYSDGKLIAPFMPEFPQITSCSKCYTIFWISKAELVGSSQPFVMSKEEFVKAEEAQFLTILEYKEVLDNSLNIKEEKYLRIRLWWEFNDRVRKNEELFEHENARIFWYENVNRLLEILSDEDPDDIIRKAELNRNLGNFEKCMEVMDSIKNENYDWLKEKFREECNKKNDKVVEINKI